ncbi:uncharacterized protein LOC112689982 [Sipha flava]|uniref:Uncharacterized protein LOC112689982 n=1 Tax=Sipha flava TaxID=143950 RepID=A0A8B8GAL3_9HEMI|nr:uncharacterized protein LOC112689982 [Sipha flava]
MKYNVRDGVRNGCELIRKLFQILGFPLSIGNQINLHSVRVMMASIENDNKTSTVYEKNLTVCEDIHVDDIGNEDKALDIIIPDLNTSMLMVIMIIYLRAMVALKIKH